MEPFLGASWQRCAIPFLTQRVHGLLLSHDICDLRHITQAWNTFFLLGFLTSGFFSSTFIFLLLPSDNSSLLETFFLSFVSFTFFGEAFVSVKFTFFLSSTLTLLSDTEVVLLWIGGVEVCSEEFVIEFEIEFEEVVNWEEVNEDVETGLFGDVSDLSSDFFFLLWIKLSNI